MKYAVFTVMMPDCTVPETLDMLQRLGYQGVEWRFTASDPARRNEKPSFWGNNLATIEEGASTEQLGEWKAKAERAGLSVPNLASYIRCGDMAATERAMRAARLLGAPSVRLGVPPYDGSAHYGDLFKAARAYLKEAEQMGKSLGVKGLIEVHHGVIASSASLARRLVEGFDPAYIGVIFDPGNMVHEGYERYRLGLELLGDYLGHVHVKNARWVRTGVEAPKGEGAQKNRHEPLWRAEWCPLTEGVVHWPQVMADLRAIGYDGWISFEDFSGSAPTETLLRHHLAYIRSLE